MEGTSNMDSTYVPAIITGIAGIAGIIINISVNTWYRYGDIKEKKKERNIVAYENFYVPLCNKLLIFQYTLKSLKNEVPSVEIKMVGDYLRNGNPPSALRTQIDDIYRAAQEVFRFVDLNSYKYITDYKTKVYYDKIMKCVTVLCRAREKHEEFSNIEFDMDYIDKFINRVDYISINIFTSNIVYQRYLRRWKNKQ